MPADDDATPIPEKPLFRQTPTGEHALAQERLTVVERLLSGWTWETDPEHRFTFMSKTVEEFTQRPAEWHYGRTREEIGNICEPAQLDAFHRSLEARESFSAIEFTREDGDGVIHMRAAGQPFFENGVFRGYRGLAYRINGEIRERQRRRQAEQEKNDCADALKAVVDHCPFAMVAFDTNEKLLWANPEYYEMFELNRSDIPSGTPFARVIELLYRRGEIRGISAEAVVDDQCKLVRSGQSMVFERSRPNGRIIRIQCFPLPCGGFARTLMDVTERTEDKWTIAALREQLRLFDQH